MPSRAPCSSTIAITPARSPAAGRVAPRLFFGAPPRPARAPPARSSARAAARVPRSFDHGDQQTGVGLRLRRFGASAANSSRLRARRHTARCEEYRPSRRNNAPTAPGVAHASASFRMRRLYSAVYVRRRGFAATCTSSGTTFTRPSMASSRLALYNNFRDSDCRIHLGTEGAARLGLDAGGRPFLSLWAGAAFATLKVDRGTASLTLRGSVTTRGVETGTALLSSQGLALQRVSDPATISPGDQF